MPIVLEGDIGARRASNPCRSRPETDAQGAGVRAPAVRTSERPVDGEQRSFWRLGPDVSPEDIIDDE